MMKKDKHRKTRLVWELGFVVVALQLINEILSLLNKVVNYDRRVWKLRISL